MENLKYTFEIKAPKDEIESDLNSLIMRIARLKHFYDETFHEGFEIDIHNRNIKEIHELLDNFIIENLRCNK